MKTFTTFVTENAKVVGYKKLTTTKFSPRKDAKKSDGKTTIREIQNGVKIVNRICNKYDAYTELSGSFHVVSRFKREEGLGDREYGVDDIVKLFEGLEKNTSFFNDLEKRSNVKREENRKAHIIDRDRKTHMIVKMLKSNDKNFKYFIPIISIMGKFDMKYINSRKNKVYYAY